MMKRLLITIAFVVILANQLFSQVLNGSKVEINGSNLAGSGYIWVKVPVYDDDENDEGITPTDDRAGYIKINGQHTIRFWSFFGDGDPQEDRSWYWVRASRVNDNFRVDIQKTAYGTSWVSITTPWYSNNYGWFQEIIIDKNVSTTWAEFRVYLPADYLTAESINVEVGYYDDENNGGDHGFQKSNASYSPLVFPVPSLSQSLSATAGMYDLGINVSPVGVYKSYRYSIDGTNYTNLPGTGTSIPVAASDTRQQKTVYMQYTVGNWDQVVTKSASIFIPAYPQARDFAVSQLPNGDTRLTWDVNTSGIGTDYIKDDEFEIQRADNESFTNPVTVASIDYDATKSSYVATDATSAENLNGSYYYRIRRTKTSLSPNWGWAVSSAAHTDLVCRHKAVQTGSVTVDINDDNDATLTWAYDNGNVITPNSEVVIERKNLITQQTVNITEPYSASYNSYTERLTALCDEFEYKIYIKPGNPKYATQTALTAELVDPARRIIPTRLGELTYINASKGYYSDRVQVDWEITGGSAETFSIKRRPYGSDQNFRQIDTKDGSDTNSEYQYTDLTAEPGQIYEYQIAGLTSCANGTLEVNSQVAYGFRTPTGDIYGRITFENGQAVEDVEVVLESRDAAVGNSLLLAAGNTATINNSGFLATARDSVTIQAWISPDNTAGIQPLFSKEGIYSLGLSDGRVYFSVGSSTIVTDAIDSYLASSSFVHVSAVFTGSIAEIYLNGELSVSGTCVPVSVNTYDTRSVNLGGGTFAGALDEVRVWNRPLGAAEIKTDYTRYISGNETGLIGYWNFNFSTATEFYDLSYKASQYNENHGSQNGTLSATRIPSSGQLSYKGITASDGSYAIRSIPYLGNGTSYTIIPRKGIHQFQSQREVRFIGPGVQSHTVNFTDVSSFEVSGTVTYAGSDIPVKDVNFAIDGKTALESNGIPKATDQYGHFEIMVPVGTHEVKAVKSGHTFVKDGKITDPLGMDLNYQDALSGIELEDSTTIKYIGRVAGGTVQEALTVGHSLSKNNLARGITVRLAYIDDRYGFDSRTVEESHFRPSNKQKAHVNRVEYGTDAGNRNLITIEVNDTTGEFVAHVIPEQFNVEVRARGHNDIPGSGSLVNLTQQFIKQQNIYSYTDSVQEGDNWRHMSFSDTVFYNFSQKFTKRYAPGIRILQVNASGQHLPYFGDDSTRVVNMTGEEIKVPLYNSNTNAYTFGKPVFTQNRVYHLKMEVFERYVRYDEEGNPLDSDEVPTQDATFTFNNDIADNENKAAVVEADSAGMATFTFSGADPEITSAIRRMNVTVTYGKSSSPTSIDWVQPGNFANGEAYVLGAHQTGTDFITAGPDKILTVLRDPPGSNSYSYLEKGVSFEETSTYTGSIKNSGSEDFTLGVKAEVVVFTGVGAGVINKTIETESGVTLGIVHEEQYEGQDTKKTTNTITTRFQTSDDPGYVGADGDVYIGYSTNVTFGSTQNVVVVPKSKLSAYTGTHYDVTSSADWALVYAEGRSISQSFNTLFAYPQVHIEANLIPQLEGIRNSILTGSMGNSPEQLQAAANALGKVFYYSYFPETSPDFGKSNDDATVSDNTHGTPGDVFDGPSYRIISPTNNPGLSVSDTILHLNQSIKAWKERMADNEKAKANAELLQNYSFHGGSNIEYSESFSSGTSHQSSFYINIGGKVSNDSYLGTGAGPKTKFAFEESVETQHGGTWTSDAEASHSKGFVLAESGTDYISVDVCREKNWDEEDEEYDSDGDGGMVDEDDLEEKDYYSSFIFKTKGGVTSCPYEDAYVSKYYEPGGHILNEATMRMEVPEIDMPLKFIENVPSGESAGLKLQLRNNSESKDDAWYNLKIVSGSNPDGARMYVDGAAIGNGLEFEVPAGQTVIKTLEVSKGTALNYDSLQLVLQSQCQSEIGDTVTFSVHYIPSCTGVNVNKPGNNWVYNTKLPVENLNGNDRHYMEVIVDGFNVNYDDFGRIELQYKTASQSEDQWTTLMSYYNDSALCEAALENGLSAQMINASDAGTIRYKFFMDDMPDQHYDLRAVSVCIINNEEVTSSSEVRSGLKDTYLPRLFGTAQPADGILGIEDEIRLNFNEAVAEGLLTYNNFQVRGVRNGSKGDHSVSVQLDGENDFMATGFEKNLTGKDLTIEMWILPSRLQNGTLFSHGNINNALELSLTSDGRLKARVGTSEVLSQPVPFEQGSWAHIALVYEATGHVSAYYNYQEVISRSETEVYTGIGNFVAGKSISINGNHFNGKLHNLRIWEKTITPGNLQVNSLSRLAGIEPGLLGYYPMNEGKGETCLDKARGANLNMYGGQWSMPPGYAVTFDGQSDLRIDAGSAAITKDMDYSIEFWFKAEAGQTNATILSNGRGDGGDAGGSGHLFAIGFDEDGVLHFTNNGLKTTLSGDFRDNNWHHFAIGVNRTSNKAQIFLDGNLSAFIDATSLGGVASAYLYLGARAWFAPENPSELLRDNYFKGKVDDLRFWELYRNERIVKENNNVKLTGEELGLIHYYPFDTYIEYQGVEYLEFTNSDMHISRGANPEADTFEAEGSTLDMVKSQDIAPLKDSGPVADLDFDFVTNNDALIITLKEPEYKVAKTIVTFTVTDVRDKNGNSTASPITWSAYIDRNQLKWSDENLKYTKVAYEPLEFTVRVVNTGGSIQNYTISNIPSWLEVTPSNGNLKPASSEEISFEVNEGLNVGTYNEVIYLSNENNVSEALNLELVVQGDKPDWTVNPGDYEYSMNVFGKMRFNNIFSSDEGDMLAAFGKGKCIGVTRSTYDEKLDMWYAFLTVYSNDKQTSDIEFRMWDASTGKIYMAVPDRSIRFVNATVAGSVNNLVIFDGSECVYQDIHLNEGWNWISFNLANESLPDVNATLANGVWTGGDIVKSMDYFDSYSADNARWVGSLSGNQGFNNTSLFMLHSSAIQVLSTSGIAVDVTSLPVPVKGDSWNFISYLPTTNYTVTEALAGYDAHEGDIIKSQNQFAMFSGAGWIGNLVYMEANRGYMLLRTSQDDVSFVYPAGSGSLGRLKSAPVSSGSYMNRDFAENMSIVAIGKGMKNGDRILAYINGELRGIGESAVFKDRETSFISVAGGLISDNIVVFRLERDGKTIAQSTNTLIYKSNTIAGSLSQPFVIDFSEVEMQCSIYPNPFKTSLNIEVMTSEGDNVEIAIFDMMGRIVMMQEVVSPGPSYSTSWDRAGNITPGIYQLRVTVNGISTLYRIVKE
jgi:hypothetical protein